MYKEAGKKPFKLQLIASLISRALRHPKQGIRHVPESVKFEFYNNKMKRMIG